MNVNQLQRTSSYLYPADAGKRKQHFQQAGNSSAADKRKGDSTVISEEGRKALEEKMSVTEKMSQKREAGKPLPFSYGACGIRNDFEKIMSELGSRFVPDALVTKDYSQESVDALKARFEEGEGSGAFDSYVNKMASAYQLLKDRIEEKYAAPDRQKEYYAAEDGSIQELTKEKELEMLDKAYETHSRFMAVSTQIWSELQDFKARTVYHSGNAKTEVAAEKSQKGNVKEQAYRAFMDAINETNSRLLKQEKGSLGSFRLEFGISSSARDILNGIWKRR